MRLTGITDEMLQKARDNTLLGRLVTARECPLEAIGELARAIWERDAADWDVHEEGMQLDWDLLPVGAKQLRLDEAAWFIARLGMAGLKIVGRGQP